MGTKETAKMDSECKLLTIRKDTKFRVKMILAYGKFKCPSSRGTHRQSNSSKRKLPEIPPFPIRSHQTMIGQLYLHVCVLHLGHTIMSVSLYSLTRNKINNSEVTSFLP